MLSAVTITIVIVAALGVLGIAAFYIRLRTLGSRVGSFECALQMPTGWASGIAHYGADSLHWYRLISPSARGFALNSRLWSAALVIRRRR